jgi:hypothetical protein
MLVLPVSIHYAALLNREIARSRGVHLIPNNLRRANFMNPPMLLPNIVLPMIRSQKVSTSDSTSEEPSVTCAGDYVWMCTAKSDSSDMRPSQAHDLFDERFGAGGLEEV